MLHLTGRSARIESIDFLRGLAVWLVLFRHHEFWPFMNRYGWIGVDLFFVISGFLVSGLLFSEYKKFGSAKPGLFLIRRGFKIYPQFYLFLAVGFAAEWFFRTYMGGPVLEITTRKIIGDVFFVQNYLDRIWGQTWSLAVEEHFYFGLALVFLVLGRLRAFITPGFMVTAIVLLLFFVLGERIFLYFWNFKKSGFYYTHLRIDSLAFGVLIAYFNTFYQDTIRNFTTRNRWWLWAFFAAVVVGCYRDLPMEIFPKKDPFTKTFGFTLLYLGFGAVLLLALYTTDFQRLKQNAVSRWFFELLTWSGFCSYAIYLWHVFVEKYLVDWAEPRFGITQAQTFVPFVVLTLLISYITTEYFEVPVLRLRDRYFPRRTQ